MHYKQKLERNDKSPKVIIYGESGTGKTLEAVRLAEKHNLLMFDLEQGSEVIELLPEEYWDRINLVPVRDSPNSPNALETMLYFFDNKPGYVCWEHGKWNCMKCRNSEEKTEVHYSEIPKDTIVIIDSLSQLSTSINNHIANKMNYKLWEGDKFEWDDWGKSGQILARILTGIQSAPFPVITISHEAELEQSDKTKKLTPIGGTTNFSRSVPKYFGHVLRKYNFGGALKTASSTAEAKKFVAKSRANLDLGKDATLMDIMDGKVAAMDWGNTEADGKKAIDSAAGKKTLSATPKSKLLASKLGKKE